MKIECTQREKGKILNAFLDNPPICDNVTGGYCRSHICADCLEKNIEWVVTKEGEVEC